MKEVKLGEVCPACGLRRSVFEPYEDKVSARRRFILDLDLHPILVHFPQTLATILPPLIVATILFPTFYGQELLVVAGFTALVLPAAAVGALISGLIDARVKLKTLRTPALVRKIAAACSLLAFSAVNALIVAFYGCQPGNRVWILALSVASFLCAVLLGMMGKRLIPVIRPG